MTASNPNLKALTVRIQKNIWEEIKKMADAEHTTLANITKKLITKGMEKQTSKS